MVPWKNGWNLFVTDINPGQAWVHFGKRTLIKYRAHVCMMRFGSVTYRVHIRRIYVIYSYDARPRPNNFTGLGWVLDQQVQWNLEIWTWPIPTTCKCSGSWWAGRGLHTGECRNVNESGSGWVNGGPNLDLDVIYFVYWASMTPAWFRLNPEPDPLSITPGSIPRYFWWVNPVSR